MMDRTGQVWIVRSSIAPADDWLFVVTGPSRPNLRFNVHPILYSKADRVDVTTNGETIGSDTQWEENESYTRLA